LPFRGYLHQLKELKKRYPDLKVFISLEGTAESFRNDAQPENVRAFVTSCVDLFLRGHFAPGMLEPGIFDGIDVDWEYPQQADAENFHALLKEFRQQMNGARRGFKLGIAVGDQPQMQPGTDFRKIARMVDEVGIMNYDYTGPWEHTTGFLAPLFSSSREYGSVAESIAAYEKEGVPSRKLLMGVPFYGYQWSGVTPANHGLYQRGKGISEDRPYRVIRELQPSYSKFRHPKSLAPWLFDGANFWTFDDPTSIAYKSSYAAHQHLGGIMIWELGDDTIDASLLTAAWQYLRHPDEMVQGAIVPQSAIGGS
jgi:chitinase